MAAFSIRSLLQTLAVLVISEVQAFTEIPKFSQMKLLYPGYHLHGGDYRNRDVITLVGGNHTAALLHLQNTSPLRMSVTLNRYGGRHAIGTEPITLGNSVAGEVVSVLGWGHQQYIFHNTAYGPYLATKYGNPTLAKANKHKPSRSMDPFLGKQGIARLVSYHSDHAGGHVALWDCDHFFQSPDWSTEHHLISVEFWETPDSYCPPKDNSMDLSQLLQKFRLIPRDPTVPPVEQQLQQTTHHRRKGSLSAGQSSEGSTHHRLRHSRKTKKLHRLKSFNLPIKYDGWQS